MGMLQKIALVLALIGAAVAAYDLTGPFGQYDDVKEESYRANDMLRRMGDSGSYGDPLFSQQMEMARAKEREAHDRYYEVRTRCQNLMLIAMPLCGLGFLLGLVGLRSENKGPAVGALVVAAIGGGLMVPMLIAGVF